MDKPLLMTALILLLIAGCTEPAPIHEIQPLIIYGPDSWMYWLSVFSMEFLQPCTIDTMPDGREIKSPLPPHVAGYEYPPADPNCRFDMNDFNQFAEWWKGIRDEEVGRN